MTTAENENASFRLLQNTLICVLIGFVVTFVVVSYYDAQHAEKGDDAVVLTKEGAMTAQWHYQQLPMKECRWCGRTVNLNRHHAVPQAANPALRDVKENLIVLCRDCHFVLGHRCDWKRYNPDVMYIATHFTNCVRSADTRKALTNGVTDAVVQDPDWRTTVTNRESLDEAIRRMFDGTEGQRTN